MKFITMQTDKKKIIYKIAMLLFWIGVWQCAFLIVNKEILVASPAEVLERLFELVKTQSFWLSSFYSLLRVMCGYVLAVVFGTVLAVLTSSFEFLYELFKPIISLVRSTPVASFILLALVWLKRDYVAVFISFLMVLPVVWSNVTQGIRETDGSLLEMAEVFNFSFMKKIRMIYLHSVFPYFISGCTSALGLAWKSGIAAEVLSTPVMSIGYNLYRSKINIETVDLFAWTAVVILLSAVLEKVMLYIFKKAEKKSGKAGKKND